MISGSPTAGGFAGYFSARTKNNTNHIIPARIKVFLMLLFEWGNNKDLLYTALSQTTLLMTCPR